MNRIAIALLMLLVLPLAGVGGELYAQRKVPFNGVLLDVNGNPIKNAKVYVTSPRAYCPTDKKGNFGLTDVKGTDTLRIELKKKLYSIPVDGRKSMKIRLADEKDIVAEQDQQLIDIGYGHVKRRERTSAAEAFISGKDLADAGVSSIIEGLSGRVAGLLVEYDNGEYKVTMRGNKSIMGPSTPLYVLDGFRTATLDNVNVLDVDYIEILKDGSIYGSEGANGAIVVWTKK